MFYEQNMTAAGATGDTHPESTACPKAGDVAICVQNLSKVYQVYDRPEDRLKQSIYPRVRSIFGREPRNHYREFWALNDVSFDVKKGETVGIVGRNGSGKSTLLQLISGTSSPTTGVIETQGRIAALLELGSGFNPEFTGSENVFMNAAVLGLTKHEIDERFDDIAAFADIGCFIDQPIKTYSSGMIVRLAFAVAINTDPEILIIDEALSVGDELFQRKCFSRIEAIKDGGATILFVSHSGTAVIDLCDRAVLIDAGEKLAIGAPKAIVGQYHKLLYAPAGKYEETRSLIRATIDEPISALNIADEAVGPESESAGAGAGAGADINDLFDPDLKPESTIVYESRGASISSVGITTLAGVQANNLVRGQRYRLQYEVEFTQPSSNVRFGMLIKTTAGTELGGSVSANDTRGSVDRVEAGARYRVEFYFNCSLSPGVYFMNAGVLGSNGGSEVFLDRVIDVLVFRVLPESSFLGTGIVDFGCRSSFELL